MDVELQPPRHRALIVLVFLVCVLAASTAIASTVWALKSFRGATFDRSPWDAPELVDHRAQ